MSDIGQKIDIAGFEIASGVVLGIALIMAFGRTYIKLKKFHRLFADDILFILATVLLVAATAMLFVTLPYNQTEVNVGAGVQAPPPDLGRQLDLDVKFQDSATFLLNASIYCVKFSFLFFFRLLLQRTGKLQVLWWCVFIFTIPCAIIGMCTNFIVCPAFGERIMEVCVSNSALRRQIDVLYVVVVLDIFTDLLLISIPILLLWSVRINLRRKFGLGSLLCLSIFAIITNIFRASGHKLKNGQDDVVWILFWGEMEGCVAVMANSMTAFRSLFTTVNSQGGSPQNQEQSPVLKMRQRKQGPQVDLPTMPSATFTGIRSMLRKDPFEDHDVVDNEMAALKEEEGIRVTHSFHGGFTEKSQSTRRDWYENRSPPHETFV